MTVYKKDTRFDLKVFVYKRNLGAPLLKKYEKVNKQLISPLFDEDVYKKAIRNLDNDEKLLEVFKAINPYRLSEAKKFQKKEEQKETQKAKELSKQWENAWEPSKGRGISRGRTM